MDKLASINIFTDGGSRGNPGQAALGTYVETDDGHELVSIGKTLGITTNNIAEYSAIVEGLNWVKDNIKKMPKLEKVNFYMDSNLAVQQLNGFYKIKNPGLRILFFEAKKLESEINLPIYYTHIPRERNKIADKLVNMALDNQL